jgi:hypothetical protein
MNRAVPTAYGGSIPTIIKEGVVMNPPPTPKAEDIIPTKNEKTIANAA